MPFRHRPALLERPTAPVHAGRGWTIWLPVAALAALPVLALYAPKALPGLVIILMAPALSAGVRESVAWPRPSWPIVAALAGFVGLGAASALWSIDPATSVAAAAKLAGWAVVATVLFTLRPPPSARGADLGARALIAGFVGALILMSIDLNADLAVLKLVQVGAKARAVLYAHSLNRGATVIALLLCPVVALCLSRGRLLTASAVGFLALAVIGASSSATAMLAAIVGIVAFMAVRWRGGPVIRLLAGAMALWLIAAPLVLSAGASGAWAARLVPKLEPADVHRLLIWEFTTDRIAERPVLGWGLDSARRIPGGKQNLNEAIRDRFDAADYDYLKRVFANNVFEALPLHPHSLALQIWLELGAAGALLAAALVWLALGAAAAAPSRHHRASLAGTAAAGFVIANLSYGAWQSWWLAALILAVAINLALVREPAAAPAQT